MPTYTVTQYASDNRPVAPLVIGEFETFETAKLFVDTHAAVPNETWTYAEPLVWEGWTELFGTFSRQNQHYGFTVETAR